MLKPYDEDKLNIAIEKYFDFNIPTPVEFSKIESFLEQLKSKEKNTNIQERFLVSRGEQLISIKSNEIAYFMAYDKYLFLFTNSGDSFLYEDTISNIELKLSSKDFF